MDVKKILVPIDGSEDSKKALDTAIKLAEKFDSQIILLNVIQSYNDYSHLTIQHYNILEEDMKLFKKKSEELLEKTKEELKYINVKTISIEGYAVDKIIAISEEEKVDLIIMATHGMSRMKRYLIGSVTNNVVHHSKIPVLVIP